MGSVNRRMCAIDGIFVAQHQHVTVGCQTDCRAVCGNGAVRRYNDGIIDIIHLVRCRNDDSGMFVQRGLQSCRPDRSDFGVF